MAVLHASRMTMHPADSSLESEELVEATQFLSTLLIYQGKEGISQKDIQTLTPKLLRWKTERVDSDEVLGLATDRCRDQLSPNLCVVSPRFIRLFYIFRMLTTEYLFSATSMMCRMMKAKLEKDLYECAFEGCTKRRPHGGQELSRCGR